MAMTVMNNACSMMALGELKKNDTALGKQLKKVASGMKINSAGDGASEYSMSERMRVRLRALEQDEQNVQTGASMLHTAEGGIQEQINILRTIKQKVIDANNDTNTDIDRATIQKEIDQGYDQIEDIAAETTYNSRRVLLGGTTDAQVVMWDVKEEAVLVPSSDKMNAIPNNYAALDGVEGPFDIFEEYTQKAATMTTIGLQSTQKYSGATDGTAGTYEVDFSTYSSAVALDGVGIRIGGHDYVLTTDTNKDYNASSYTGINISGCSTVADVVGKIASSSLYYCTATASGTKLTITTTTKSSSANDWTIEGFSAQEDKTEKQTVKIESRDEIPSTGKFTPAKSLTGGRDQVGKPSSDPDAKYVPSQTASLTVNLSGVAAGTGITLKGYYGSISYVKFVAGSEGFKYDQDLGIYTVGLNANDTARLSNMTVKCSNGTISFTSDSTGTLGNQCSVSDGIPSRQGRSYDVPEKVYHAVTAWSGTVDNKQTGTDGTAATYTIDLSNVSDSTDPADVETVITDLRGKSFIYESSNNNRYNFIDSADATSLAGTAEGLSGKTIDLNALRSMVGKTTTTTTTDASGNPVTTTTTATVRSALSALLISKLSQSSEAADGSGNVVLKSRTLGAAANNTTLDVYTSTFRHYDIDYAQWFKDNADKTIPDYLYNKGFRFYCATDKSQWFNVLFTDGTSDEDRPKSGTSTQDIKTMPVNVSAVKTAADLVTAIYNQTMPLLTGTDKTYNHHYRIAAEPSTGILTVYDRRRYDVSDTDIYDYQEKGAKIADGVWDNVLKNVKNMRVDRLIIQHTDKANQNITIDLPRTTLDEIFVFIPGKNDISEYNVMTKSMRERLLGNRKTQGILDRGLQYLTDANTLVGAQTNHLYFAHSNIKAEQEGTQSSESTIRDSDMAKEMVGYTKANILAQTAQSMLAQANQNAGSVMNLLQ